MDLSKNRILIVEDNHQLRDIWQKLFNNAKIPVSMCGSASTARAWCDEHGVPEILVTDYFLPDRNGVDLINEFRQYDSMLPCLLVTGNDDLAMLENLHVNEDIQYMRKPVKFLELQKKIFSMLQQPAALN